MDIIGGKVQRVEKEEVKEETKITGPIVQSGITEVEIKETASPKKTERVITEKKEVKKKSKTKKK